MLRTGFSTCPNDTFVFDALVHHRINTLHYQFAPFLLDVQELNQQALSDEPIDIIKVSCAHLPSLLDRYVVLNAGAALGYNCGPLLVAKEIQTKQRLTESTVATPGEHTTAHFLLTRFFPEITRKEVMLFSDIEPAILQGKADAGVIIHESRFTYRELGLHLLADLGQMWHDQTQMPLPLGCIVVSRSLPKQTIHDINRLLKESIEYARKNPDASKEYVQQHAVSLRQEVIRQHIGLYVNRYTVDLGMEGKQAITSLLANYLPKDHPPLFADEL